ncbi:MAG: T9SS type A sorting domain-containing protein [Bacteroidetes bacterium]|nr:T9SS type A sorting domain-containing protein [Bacteroidota bacterium]
MIGQLKAQSSFIYNQFSKEDDFATDAIQLADSSYIILCATLDTTIYKFKPFVIYLDKFGNFVNTKQLEHSVSGSLFLTKIAKDNAGDFYITGNGSYDTSIYRNYIYLSKYDSNFDTLWTKLFFHPDTSHFCVNHYYDGTNFYLACDTRYDSGPSFNYRTIVSFSTAGNLLNTYKIDSAGYGYSININKKGAIQYSVLLWQNTGQGSLLDFSSTLNFVDSCSTNFNAIEMEAVSINKSTYVVFDEPIFQGNNYTAMGAAIIDSNCQSIKNIKLGTFNIDERVAYFHGLDTISSNRIIVGSTLGFSYGGTFYVPKQSQFHIAMLDDSLNIIWDKKVGDDAYHVLTRIMPTMDGGVLAIGFRYDYLNVFPSPNRDVIVMKFDSLGNITGYNEIDNSIQNQISIYPNPANTEVTIYSNINEEAEVIIYSIKGQLIEKKTLHGTIKVDVSNYNNGIYYCTVETSKQRYQKKFVIAH